MKTIVVILSRHTCFLMALAIVLSPPMQSLFTGAVMLVGSAIADFAIRLVVTRAQVFPLESSETRRRVQKSATTFAIIWGIIIVILVPYIAYSNAFISLPNLLQEIVEAAALQLPVAQKYSDSLPNQSFVIVYAFAFPAWIVSFGQARIIMKQDIEHQTLLKKRPESSLVWLFLLSISLFATYIAFWSDTLRISRAGYAITYYLAVIFSAYCLSIILTYSFPTLTHKTANG